MSNILIKDAVKIAIKKCGSVEFPIIVTGSEFGDDLALALAQIIELSEKVHRLEKIISSQMNHVEITSLD